MQTGFYYKGIHTSAAGVCVATKSRPILPQIKRIEFETSAGDGMIDLSSWNELKRPLYNERIFTINMQITAENLFMLQNKLAAIASWLNGSGELMFDDCPGVIWEASVIDEIGYVPERKGKKAILSVNFNVKPFSAAPFTADKGPRLGDPVMLSYKIPIGLPKTLVFEKTAENNTFVVKNIGTAYTKPIITINGESSETGTYYSTITINGRSISLEALQNGLTVIDMESGRTTRNGTPISPSDGSLLELVPGDNEMTVSTFDGAKIAVSYTPRFIYCWEV